MTATSTLFTREKIGGNGPTILIAVIPLMTCRLAMDDSSSLQAIRSNICWQHVLEGGEPPLNGQGTAI